MTPATFDPESGNFDELYAGGNGFKNGVPLISESKPGEQDYNGGRWHMNVLKSGVDPNNYMSADRVEDLILSDFQSTDNYFECPLLPRRGNNEQDQIEADLRTRRVWAQLSGWRTAGPTGARRAPGLHLTRRQNEPGSIH